MNPENAFPHVLSEAVQLAIAGCVLLRKEALTNLIPHRRAPTPMATSGADGDPVTGSGGCGGVPCVGGAVVGVGVVAGGAVVGVAVVVGGAVGGGAVVGGAVVGAAVVGGEVVTGVSWQLLP